MSARRLPPLGALRAFEAAARLRSFKRAAQELSVTPTAISHQIRALEDHVGVRLFERQTRRVVPTAAAERLFPVLRDGFDAFAAAVDALRAQPQRRALTLSATLSFTAKWLVPRMASFRQACPDLDLRLHASDDPVDLQAGVADAAIRYGRGPWPGLDAQPLLGNRFAPVCSPHLGLRRPRDLRQHALLHSEWRHPSADTPTWRRWRERAMAEGFAPQAPAVQAQALVDHAIQGHAVKGRAFEQHAVEGHADKHTVKAHAAEPHALDELDIDAGLHFTDESHAIQAAVAGQGVALLSLTLVADDLASGALIQPFGPALDGHPHWWVQAPGAERADLAALRDWLLAQAAAG